MYCRSSIRFLGYVSVARKLIAGWDFGELVSVTSQKFSDSEGRLRCSEYRSGVRRADYGCACAIAETCWYLSELFDISLDDHAMLPPVAFVLSRYVPLHFARANFAESQKFSEQ
jgi:hypothetical protein